MEWFDAKTNPPKKAGEYLCTKDFAFGDKSRKLYAILSYSKNLESVNKWDFYGKKRPGWYWYDSEYGYIESDRVTHWIPLPELPDA